VLGLLGVPLREANDERELGALMVASYFDDVKAIRQMLESYLTAIAKAAKR